MADFIKDTLAKFDPTAGERYEPGSIIIMFDNRVSRTAEDRFSYVQSYWTEAKYRLGWPSWEAPNLEPGKLRLVWYTHVGVEGSREYPLWMAYTVKEMFDSLSDGGFRPMVLGWSGENPFPMIGGSEPPPEPKMAQPKRAKTWSANVSGHVPGETPHDRIMAIINEEERKEAEQRKREVESESLLDGDAV